MATDSQSNARTFVLHRSGKLSGVRGYSTGLLPENRQSIMGWCGKELVCAVFDAEGRLLDYQSRRLALPDAEEHHWTVLDELRATIKQTWQAEIGFVPSPVRVQQFFIQTDNIELGIALYQNWAYEFLSIPFSRPPLEAHQGYRRTIDLWRINGWYVFWCGEEDTEIGSDGGHLTGRDLKEGLAVELPTDLDSSDRVYPLRSFSGDLPSRSFQTGHLPDGSPTIFTLRDNDLLCVVFDSPGQFRHVQTRPVVPFDPLQQPEQVSQRNRVLALAADRMLAWQQELGWREGIIRIRRFRLFDRVMCITDHHSAFTRVLVDPIYHYPSESDRQKARAELAEWEDSGTFIFWCDAEYSVDRDGNVIR